jgi:hypothetical protein
MSAAIASMAVLIRTFGSGIHTHPDQLKMYITPSNGIVRVWLLTEFGAELPLENCTPKIISNNHVYMYTESDSKLNRLNFLFPQSGYNVRLKGFHILNAPPFCDVCISLLKHVFKSKLAARVSDFKRLHFYFYSALLHQYSITPSIECATYFSSSFSSLSSSFSTSIFL